MRCLGICVLGVLFGCTAEPGDRTPVKVGLLAPKTGALTGVGESFDRVAQVAVASINDLGGIGGRDLELVVEDTETIAETAGEKLQGMIDQGVVAVVGPATSGEVADAFAVARDARVPIISPSSTAPGLSRPAPTGPDDQGYMFRNVPDDEIQGVAIAHYLLDRRDPRAMNVAVLFENTAYGIGLKNAFKTSFEDRGGTVFPEIDFEQNLPDAAAARTEIDLLVAAVPQPTVVVMIALEQDAIKLVNAWDNGGTPLIAGMQFFFTDGARSGTFLTATPPSVRGMCGTAPTFPITGLAYGLLQTTYNGAYEDEIGDQVYGPNVWDAFHLIAAALVHQSRNFSGEELGGEHLRDAITTVSRDGQVFTASQWRDLVSAIRNGNDVDYDGAAGPNDFDVVGQAVGPYEVWCIAPDGASYTQALFLEAEDIQNL